MAFNGQQGPVLCQATVRCVGSLVSMVEVVSATLLRLERVWVCGVGMAKIKGASGFRRTARELLVSMVESCVGFACSGSKEFGFAVSAWLKSKVEVAFDRRKQRVKKKVV